MSMKDVLNQALIGAMKSKESEKVKVLRGVQASIKKIEIDQRIDLDDSAILQVLQKEIKQRQESITIFSNNGRQDLADKEQFELDVIAQFLPKALDEAELLEIIKQTISDLSATSIKDMGKVMNEVKVKTAGRADPAVISGLVKQLLV